MRREENSGKLIVYTALLFTPEVGRRGLMVKALDYGAKGRQFKSPSRLPLSFFELADDCELSLVPEDYGEFRQRVAAGRVRTSRHLN